MLRNLGYQRFCVEKILCFKIWLYKKGYGVVIVFIKSVCCVLYVIIAVEAFSSNTDSNLASEWKNGRKGFNTILLQ